MDRQSSNSDSQNLDSFAETALDLLDSMRSNNDVQADHMSPNNANAVQRELVSVDFPESESDALEHGNDVHRLGDLNFSMNQDFELIQMQENAAGSVEQVWPDFDDKFVGITSPDSYAIAEVDNSWPINSGYSIMQNPIEYGTPFSPITGEISGEDPESMYNNLIDGSSNVINDSSITLESAMIYDSQVSYNPLIDNNSISMYSPLDVETFQAAYNSSLIYNPEAMYSQSPTERSQAMYSPAFDERSPQAIYDPSMNYNPQAIYHFPVIQSAQVVFVPSPIEKSPTIYNLPVMESSQARYDPPIVEISDSKASENQALAHVNNNSGMAAQLPNPHHDQTSYGNSNFTNPFFIQQAYSQQAASFSHRAADRQTPFQEDAYYKNMRVINWNGMQLVTEDKKSKRYSEHYSSGASIVGQQTLQKRNTLPYFLYSETLRKSSSKISRRNSSNSPIATNQRHTGQSLLLPAATAHISARNRASWSTPNDRVSKKKYSLPPVPLEGVQKTDTAPSTVNKNSSKSKSKPKKCCCCFPATKRGVTYCVILTFFVLSMLGLMGYFLFPKTPEFSPKLYRSETFQDNGLNITKTSSDFIATMNLLMNVSVYNPNPYEITIRELDLKASLQPNASALANSGLPGTNGLTKDATIPSTVVGTGSTGGQYFPAKSTTIFTFPVIVKLTGADFFANPYLRADILQACTADENGGFPRRFTFIYVVTLRNDFLDIFRYTPTITSTSSVLCPLNQAQTEFLKKEILSLPF